MTASTPGGDSKDLSPTGSDPAGGSPFAATVGVDPDLDSTVILLLYEDRADPGHSLSVGIAPDLGSNMFRLRAGELDLIHCEQELLKARDFTGNFVLWPLPNRIRDKRYSYRGRDYSLAEVKRPRGNDVLIHGLVFDRAWQHDTPVVAADSASVTTYIDVTPQSPHFAAYPFESRLSLTYTLRADGVTVTYTVENRGSDDLPYGFALHPYFAALSGRDDTRISVPATTVMEADDELLPTGRLLDATGVMYGMFDLRAPRPLSALMLDHVYTGVQLGESASVDYHRHGLRLRITASDDFTHYVVYVPNGEPYFCLENQTCATDAVNLAQRGLTEMAHLLELRPGERASGFIRYAVEYD